MVIKIKPIFFIKNARSKEIKKRLVELTQYLAAIENTIREPVTRRRRASKKYQDVVDDYHKLIEEFNAARKREVVMLELVIRLMYWVDYSTNPDTNDEIFSRLSKGERT